MATILQLLSQKHCSRLRAAGLRYAVSGITFVLIVFHCSVRLFAWEKKQKYRQRGWSGGFGTQTWKQDQKNVKQHKRGRIRKVSSHRHTPGQDTERHCRSWCREVHYVKGGSTHSLRTEGGRGGRTGSHTIGDCAVTCIGRDDRLCIVFCLGECGREGLGWRCARGFSEKRAKEGRIKKANAKSEMSAVTTAWQ